jgi:hypothetical protein
MYALYRNPVFFMHQTSCSFRVVYKQELHKENKYKENLSEAKNYTSEKSVVNY